MSIDLENPETHKMFMRWANGNENAARLLLQFAAWARQVDDLVDEGDDVQRRISSILELSLIHIAGNPFYMQFHQAMSAVVFEMLTYWAVGDEFKKSEDEKKNVFGFVYRESTDRLAVVIAGLVGGSGHALAVAKELYEMTHGQSPETVSDWKGEDLQNGTVRKHPKSARPSQDG